MAEDYNFNYNVYDENFNVSDEPINFLKWRSVNVESINDTDDLMNYVLYMIDDICKSKVSKFHEIREEFNLKDLLKLSQTNEAAVCDLIENKYNEIERQRAERYEAAARAAESNALNYRIKQKRYLKSKIPNFQNIVNYEYNIKNSNTNSFKFNDGFYKVSLKTKRNNIRKRHVIPYHNPYLNEWRDQQTSYISTLTDKDKIIITNYSYKTDNLINNFVRYKSGGLTREYYNLHGPFASKSKMYFPFIVQLFDKYETVLSGLGSKSKYVKESSIDYNNFNDDVVKYWEEKKLILDDGFLESIALKYIDDLIRIISNSPKLTQSIFVYRGTKTMEYVTTNTFDTKDFLSTSLLPKIALGFTGENTNTRIKCCLYEFEVMPYTPCLYISSVSRVSHEEEILFPPESKIQIENNMYIKNMYTERDTADHKNLKNLLNKSVISTVGVVKGILNTVGAAGGAGGAGARSRRHTRRKRLRKN